MSSCDRLCTQASKQAFSWSWPSCGISAWSDLPVQFASCRIVACPMPICSASNLVEHDLVFGVVLACRAERVFSLGNAYHCALLVDFLISTQLLQCGCKYKSEGALICSTTEKSAQNRPCFFRFFPQHEEKFTSNFSRRGMGDRAFAGWEYSKKFVLLQHHRHPIIRHLPH